MNKFHTQCTDTECPNKENCLRFTPYKRTYPTVKAEVCQRKEPSRLENIPMNHNLPNSIISAKEAKQIAKDRQDKGLLFLIDKSIREACHRGDVWTELAGIGANWMAIK